MQESGGKRGEGGELSTGSSLHRITACAFQTFKHLQMHHPDGRQLGGRPGRRDPLPGPARMVRI